MLSPCRQALDGVTVVRKGAEDAICSGGEVGRVSAASSPRRCGGQGDVLAGTLAVFIVRAPSLAHPPPVSSIKACVGCDRPSVHNVGR